MAISNNLGLYLPVREDYISVKRDLSDNYEVIDAAVGELDVIINGNTASVNVTSGQFVTVINSTITGITDGIYKATANVSAGTAFTSSNLQSVTSGALNDLNSQISTLNGKIASLDAGTYTLVLKGGEFSGSSGIYRFFHPWANKKTSKSVTINSISNGSSTISPSLANVQTTNDYLQIYSTDSAFNQSNVFYSFNVTVTVS